LENLYAATDQYESAHQQYPGYQNVIGSARRKGSWVVALLPQLDGNAVYDTWTDPGQEPRFIYMEVLNCPSDSSQAVSNFPSLSYVANAGWGGTVSGSGAHLTADSIYDGPFVDRFDDSHDATDNRKPNVNKDTVIHGDGMPYTLLFSENLHEARQPSTLTQPANTWISIEAPDNTLVPPYVELLAPKRFTVFLWFTPVPPPSSLPIPPDDNPPLSVHAINGNKLDTAIAIVDNTKHDAARPSSFHPGGVNVIFAAGNAQFLSETISYRVFQQLCTTNDKKSTFQKFYAPINPLSDSDFQ
jgi:hypothetical protein